MTIDMFNTFTPDHITTVLYMFIALTTVLGSIGSIVLSYLTEDKPVSNDEWQCIEGEWLLLEGHFSHMAAVEDYEACNALALNVLTSDRLEAEFFGKLLPAVCHGARINYEAFGRMFNMTDKTKIRAAAANFIDVSVGDEQAYNQFMRVRS